MNTRKMTGEMLVEAGIISQTTLERALERQKAVGKKIGVVLEEMGVITEEEIIDALSSQLSIKAVKKISGYNFSPETLMQVPVDFALEHTVFPLQLKSGVLALAVADPFSLDVTDYLSRKTGLKILPVLAPNKEILAAIREHYLKDEKAVTDSSRRILVVEDSPVVSAVIKAALEREGFEVVQAADGIEGLQAAMTAKPNLILCDSVMPKMDGFSMKRALSAQAVTADIPVILLTSKASPEEEQKAFENGFFDFIAKPVNAVRIVSRIRRALKLTADR